MMSAVKVSLSNRRRPRVEAQSMYVQEMIVVTSITEGVVWPFRHCIANETSQHIRVIGWRCTSTRLEVQDAYWHFKCHQTQNPTTNELSGRKKKNFTCFCCSCLGSYLNTYIKACLSWRYCGDDKVAAEREGRIVCRLQHPDDKRPQAFLQRIFTKVLPCR